MGTIQHRLEKIKYQIIKGESMSDDARVLAARSIYDAAINQINDVINPHTLPTEALGVTLSWDVDGDVVSLSKGAYEIVNDNLTDNIIPGFGTDNIFEFDSETFEFELETFELRTA